MRILRRVLIVMAVVVVVMAGAAAVLYKTFDPNDHRDRVVDFVAEKTGRKLRLDAPMTLSFFPWLGVELGKVTLENPPGFGHEPFATVEDLAVRVRVLPLLDGHFVVDTLEVNGLAVKLHRLGDGRDNWSGLVAQPSSARGRTRKPEESAEWLKGYALQGVRLTNGAVSWRDDRAGTYFRVDDLDLATGTIAPGAAVPVEGHLRLEGIGEGMATELDLTGNLGVSEDPARVQMPDLRLELVARGPALPPAGARAEIATAFTYDHAAGDLAIDDLKMSVPGGVELAGTLQGKLTEPLRLDGEFTLEPFSPREALAALQIDPPATNDPGVLASASGGFKLNATTDRITVAPLSIRFDDTRVNGQAGIGLGSPLAVDFFLEIDRIDLDRYLSPPEIRSTPQRAMAQGERTQGAGLAGLAGMPARGTVAIGTLKVAGVTMSNTRVGISSGNGVIRLDPMNARLYGGEFRGALALKAAGADVQWRATEQVKGVKIGPLLRDLAGEDRLTGTGRVDVDLKGRGLSDAAVRRSAQGNLKFEFRNGTLKGVNLVQVMRELKATLKGRRLEQTGPLQTDFSSLTGTLKIGGAMAKNDDLVIKSPVIRVTGKGDANLVEESIDYLLTAKVVTNAAGQGRQEFADFEGIPVGVRVGGTFSEPSFEPDFEPALKALVKQQLDGQQEKLEEKAKNEIEKALKRFF